MRILFFVLWMTFFCSFSVVFAQHQEIDSLRKILETLPLSYTISDTLRVQTLNNLAFALRNIEVGQAAQIAKEASELAKRINYSKGLARSLGYEGMMAYRQGKYDFAITFHYQSLKIANQISDSTLISFRYNDLANVYLDKGDIEKSVEYNLKSLAIKRSRNDQEGIATSYRNLGIAKLRQKDYESALLYLGKAKNLAEKIDNQRILGYIYIYLGELYTQQKQIGKAIEFLEKAVRIQRQINNFYGLAEALNSLAEAHEQGKTYAKIIFLYTEALNIAQQKGIKLEIQRAYWGLSKIYQKQKALNQALYFYQKYTQIKDSIFSEKSTERIAYLEAQFQNETKQAQIILLTKEKALKQQEIEKEHLKSNIFMIIIAFVVILFALLAFGFVQKRKTNTILTQQKKNLLLQNEEINQQKEHIYQNLAELQQAKEEIEAQTDKLQKINHFKDRLFSILAHDLRSPMANLQNTISILDPDILNKSELEMVKKEITKQFEVTDKILQDLLQWAKDQMKGETIDFKPLNFNEIVNEKLDLFTAIAQSKNISLLSEVLPDTQVFADENHVNIILQNLLSNALKFTYAGGSITITSQNIDKMVQITVKDTGKGMNEEQQSKLFSTQHFTTKGTAEEKGNGLGLLLVRDLVEKNGGKIWVKSEEGKGSEFCLLLPISQH